LLELRNNPLQTVVLPDALATNRLANLVQALEASAVTVHVYPVSPRLAQPRVGEGVFQATLEGPPGVHQVQHTPDLLEWTAVAQVTNVTGSISVGSPMVPPFGATRTELVYFE
jgi:hypothetical protein